MLPYGLAIAVALSSSILFLTAFFMPRIHRQDDFLWSGLGLLYALILWFCAPQISGALLLGQLVAVVLLTSYFWQVIKLRRVILQPEPQLKQDGFSVTKLLGGIFKPSPQADGISKQKNTSKTSLEQPKETLIPTQTDTYVNPVASETVVDDIVDTVLETKEETPLADQTVETTTETSTVVKEGLKIETVKISTTEETDNTVIQVQETIISATPEDSSLEKKAQAQSQRKTSSNEPTKKKGNLFGKLLNVGDKKADNISLSRVKQETSSLTNKKLDDVLDAEWEESAKPQETIKVTMEEEANWDYAQDESNESSEKIIQESSEVAKQPEKPVDSQEPPTNPEEST